MITTISPESLKSTMDSSVRIVFSAVSIRTTDGRIAVASDSPANPRNWSRFARVAFKRESVEQFGTIVCHLITCRSRPRHVKRGVEPTLLCGRAEYVTKTSPPPSLGGGRTDQHQFNIGQFCEIFRRRHPFSHQPLLRKPKEPEW
ncbi:hypothetical protein AB0D08_38535 [Kitasatospora sp. NPDC048540]|uniref:hypothetical protein n=1 Tax=Kitasatospora sp. NPDC048540 TaxID=3155634 RepID=UPI0033D42CBE